MYQLLIRLLSPLVIVLIAVDAIKRQGGWRFFGQRLGFNYSNISSSKKVIWIHCASVGEVTAAEPLIEKLLQQAQQYEVVVSTNTPTGYQLLQQSFQNQIQHSYCPFDWTYAINNFLQAVKANELWVMETEIWPNLYKLCHQQQIKIKILNARLSKKTLNAPQWLQNSYRQSLGLVDQILSRSQAETARFIQLGAVETRILTIGNIKYAKLNQLTNSNSPVKRDYVLAASTHNGEELAIAQNWLKLKRNELLIIVPRHPKRMPAIRKQLKTLKVKFAIASLKQAVDTDTQIYLIDQIGKLLPLYEHAKLVIMGGSFVEKGGHNILEPAAYAKAILTGPDMSDFESETSLMLNAQGIVQCQNYDDLFNQITHLFQHPEQLEQLAKNAKTLVSQENDIIDLYLQALKLG